MVQEAAEMNLRAGCGDTNGCGVQSAKGLRLKKSLTLKKSLINHLQAAIGIFSG